MFMKISLLAVAAVSACAAFASPALAGSMAPDGASVTVSVQDLDLNHQAGATVALQRIRAAARTVCGSAPHITDLTNDATYRSCVSEAVERGVQTLGAAKVTALNGGPAAAEMLASQR
jgi:UrcA family protein